MQVWLGNIIFYQVLGYGKQNSHWLRSNNTHLLGWAVYCLLLTPVHWSYEYLVEPHGVQAKSYNIIWLRHYDEAVAPFHCFIHF